MAGRRVGRFLTIADGRAVAGPALAQWPDADEATVRELWLTGLAAAVAADARIDDDAAGAAAFVRVLLAALVAGPAASIFDLMWGAGGWERGEDSYAADAFFRTHRQGEDRFAVTDPLIQFGAATGSPQQPQVTPLGRWALAEMRARMPEPITADLPAETLLARLGEIGENDPWFAVQPWMEGRHPLLAARDLLQAAAVGTPSQRVIVVEIVDGLGEAASAVWDDVTTVPNLAAHARAALCEWGRQPRPSPQDIAWLAVDYALAGLADAGPDEALTCLVERLDDMDLDSRLRVAKDSGHPDAAELVEALAAFAASDATPTSSVGYQLKISLERASPPIWRRVVVPASARLGQLHSVIQIVMGWDGDHLHAFTVGRERYGDSFHLPEDEDEDSLRLSGAFSRTKTISYLYDFGASWHHEVILEKVLDLDAAATYPVCLTGRGDFPIEYWSEDDDQVAVPFDADLINRRFGRKGPRAQ